MRLNMICTKCDEDKDESEFYNDVRARSGKRQPCKPCTSAVNMVWRRNNLDRWRSYSKQYDIEKPTRGRSRHLQRYGLTVDTYDDLLKAQGSVCAICKRPPGERSLHVDHDHSCCPGKMRSCGSCVRGLLCYQCNSAIGLLQDDSIIVRAALDYLS